MMHHHILAVAVIAALCVNINAFQPAGFATSRTLRRTTQLASVKEKARAEEKKPLDDTTKVTLTDTAEGDGVLVQPEGAKRSEKVCNCIAVYHISTTCTIVQSIRVLHACLNTT
jgi:hypothetical protein